MDKRIRSQKFFWGCATASHQIEGNTTNDWSVWEKQNAERLAQAAPRSFSKRSPVWDEIKSEATNPDNYISGSGDDSYNHWREDVALLKELGVNAYRMSVEWSRVEPKCGAIDEGAIAHYLEIIAELRKNNIEPFITILHRTVPLWFEQKGGWAHKESVRVFSKYAGILAERFGATVTYWTPLNEPVLNVTGGYFAKVIPPSKGSAIAGLASYRNMIKAHNEAYKTIRKINPRAQVGLAHAAVYAEAEHDRWYNRLLVSLVHWFMNWKFLDGVKNHADFIGIQYYTRGVIGFRKSKFLLPLPGEIRQPGPASDMGQEIYPQGLYRYGEMVWQRYHKPIIVTENGIADRNDTHRPRFIQDHVLEVRKLLDKNIDVRGYFYWSLLDNFEWDKGFWPRFGLATVDKATRARQLRKSSEAYKNITRDGI